MSDFYSKLDKVTEKANEVEKAYEATSEASTERTREERARKLRDLASEMAALAEDVRSAVGAGGVEMTDFFRGVGESVVEAQRQLDRRTDEYLAGKPALPSLFRIPKATAELSFALESTSEKSFNVLVFGTSEERRAAQQHSVKFDIVAAAPPAELQRQLTEGPIRSATVGDFRAYETVRRVLEEYRAEHAAAVEGTPNADIAAKCASFLAAWPRVVMLRAGDRLALLRASENHDVDLLFVQAGRPYLPWRDATRLRATGALGGMARELGEMLAELTGEQAEFLRAFDEPRED